MNENENMKKFEIMLDDISNNRDISLSEDDVYDITVEVINNSQRHNAKDYGITISHHYADIIKLIILTETKFKNDTESIIKIEECNENIKTLGGYNMVRDLSGITPWCKNEEKIARMIENTLAELNIKITDAGSYTLITVWNWCYNQLKGNYNFLHGKYSTDKLERECWYMSPAEKVTYRFVKSMCPELSAKQLYDAIHESIIDECAHAYMQGYRSGYSLGWEDAGDNVEMDYDDSPFVNVDYYRPPDNDELIKEYKNMMKEGI